MTGFPSEKHITSGEKTEYAASEDPVKNDTPDLYIDNTDEKEEQHSGLVGGDAALANAAWQFKLIALATALMLPVGSHFSATALSAMKSSLKENLLIDNARYGVLSAAVSIINTIFPIVGGVFIDLFGSVWGTLVVNLFVIIGSLLTAIAAKYTSFPLMVVGRVIFGIGSGLIVTMQESLLSKWFRTESLAIAIGLQLSISRLASFLGTLAANPVADRTGDWVWAFWLALIICVFSVIMNLVYALIVRHLSGNNVMNKEDALKLKRKKTFKFRSIAKFPLFYWGIITIEFIYAAVWSSFQTISTELIEVHFGDDSVLAGYKASASMIVPIVGTPILGIVMDLFGGRIIILLLSAVFLILSCALLGWTYVNAVVGMVFYSISLAFGPIAMITSIGMILPSDYIGTGLGMYKASNNIGTSILDIVIGVVQDNTAGQAYTGVMLLYIILGAIGFVMIVTLLITQRVYLNNLLETGRKKRQVMMKERNDKELKHIAQGEDMYQGTKVNPISIVFLGLFVAALIVAWVLFFVYAITGKSSP
ncbi:major facilitator superfamily domain-containing protein [Zychaea mexicana]|uniref:major facilitator superfamily domain-containing protein n=1 Tax=Zychaea mexicana TaxID=64656 RepID=UPI0022FE921B|nr:major facilitator superfamily domain-containing protein [Zychaea mexicana]KAI9496154.1 major facilitator superfamily domain-containing protein [Zychaea mexicana]